MLLQASPPAGCSCGSGDDVHAWEPTGIRVLSLDTDKARARQATLAVYGLGAFTLGVFTGLALGATLVLARARH